MIPPEEQFVAAQRRSDFLADQVTRIAHSVADFHERFGILPPGDKHLAQIMDERLMLLLEEVKEHQEGLANWNAPNAADELIDILYVVIGSLYMMETQIEPAILRVLMKNDAKSFETHKFHPVTGKIVKKRDQA